MLCGKNGNGTVTLSEESITLMTPLPAFTTGIDFIDDPDDALRKSSTFDKRLPDKREHPANYTASINTPFLSSFDAKNLPLFTRGRFFLRLPLNFHTILFLSLPP